MPRREPTARILWSGNLATPRRTVLGVYAHLLEAGIKAQETRAFLVGCGLPPIALDEPDIPISHAQQLGVVARCLERMDRRRSLADHAASVGFEVRLTALGIVGLCLLHAPSLEEGFRVVRSYPELSWSSCRVVIGEQGGRCFVSFAMDEHLLTAAPDPEALRSYCLTTDLTASIRMVAEMFGPEHWPIEVDLPFSAPPDPAAVQTRFACPVRFGAAEARLWYRSDLWVATPLLANPLIFRVHEKLAGQLAERLRTDLEVADQVRRVLHTATPPPDRESVAELLGLSSRTLARRLAAEGTSYGELRREVQLARARELLLRPTLHIAEIADQLGFSDATALSRAFRQWTGESPGAWRESELEDPRVSDRGSHGRQ